MQRPKKSDYYKRGDDVLWSSEYREYIKALEDYLDYLERETT